MRVLQIITHSNRGGAQVQVLAVARALMHAGHETSVAVGKTGWLTERLKEDGVAWHLLPSLEPTLNPISLMRARNEARMLGKHLNPEAVFAHAAHPTALLSALPGKRIAIVHGWSLAAQGVSWPVRWGAQIIYRILLHAADAIVCVSEADKKYGAAHCLIPTGIPVTIARNGIPPSVPVLLPRDKARKELGLSEKTFVVGAVARLTEQKRLDRVFAATHDPAWPSKARVVVLGYGPLEKTLAEQAGAHGLLRSDLKNPSEYLSAFDAFVIPSDFEGLPFAVLEAGAAGLPVIASAVDALPELLNHGRAGILIERGDVPALAEAVALLVKHPAHAHRLGTALKERVRTHYRERDMTDAILSTLTISNSSPPPRTALRDRMHS